MSEPYNLAASLGMAYRKGDHFVTVEEILRELLSKVSRDAPLPWSRDCEGRESGQSETFDHYFVGTEAGGKWLTLFDTSNSTAVCIEEDYDEDHYACWDETAWRTTGLALGAVNTLPIMLRMIDATKALAALRPSNWQDDDELVAAYRDVDAVLADLTIGHGQ